MVKPVDIVGEVVQADMVRGRLRMLLGEKNEVAVPFLHQHETDVAAALQDRANRCLRVRGSGVYIKGKLTRLLRVEDLQLVLRPENPADRERPIEEVLADLAKNIPPEEWESLPDDFMDNLDHYLYGTPKR